MGDAECGEEDERRSDPDEETENRDRNAEDMLHAHSS